MSTPEHIERAPDNEREQGRGDWRALDLVNDYGDRFDRAIVIGGGK